MISVQQISAADTWPIRNLVLRPGLPLSSCQFKEDSLPSAVHFGFFTADVLTAISSVYLITCPQRPGVESSWQIRAMACLPAYRGKGHAVALIDAIEHHLKDKEAALLWCNARTSAVGFYEKAGFSGVGGIFDMPGVGRHLLMLKTLIPSGPVS